MSDLRIFTIEIETRDDEAEYDLTGALNALSDIVQDEGGDHRIVVTEGHDEIFRFDSLGDDNETEDRFPVSDWRYEFTIAEARVAWLNTLEATIRSASNQDPE